jgi:hypothetical protein
MNACGEVYSRITPCTLNNLSRLEQESQNEMFITCLNSIHIYRPQKGNATQHMNCAWHMRCISVILIFYSIFHILTFILILTGLVSGFIFVFFGLELMIGLVSGFLLSMTEIFSRVNPKSYLGYHNYVEIWCDNDSTSLNRSY